MSHFCDTGSGTATPIEGGDSGVDSIANGSADGQTLLIVGTSDTGTVRINSEYPNTSLNGDIILGDNDAIFLMWDGSVWMELSRSN